MFCPKCKDEFVPGIKECPDCAVSLVDELPEETGSLYKPVYIDLITVFETGDPGVIMVIKSLLEEAGIRYYAKGENLQDLFGAGTLGPGFNPLTGPVQIQVSRDDSEEALKLLEQIEE